MTAPVPGAQNGHFERVARSTPDTVEQAARAMMDKATDGLLVWETLGVAGQERYLDLAAAALAAMPPADETLRALADGLERDANSPCDEPGMATAYQEAADRIRAGQGQVERDAVLHAAVDRLNRDGITTVELAAYAQREGMVCCFVGCGTGACETCPCCGAGWCVSGLDGLPEQPEDFDRWLGIAVEHNPVAARLQAVLRADHGITS